MCCLTRTRTQTDRTRICSATITPLSIAARSARWLRGMTLLADATASLKQHRPPLSPPQTLRWFVSGAPIGAAFFRKRVQNYNKYFNLPNILGKKCKKSHFLGEKMHFVMFMCQKTGTFLAFHISDNGTMLHPFFCPVRHIPLRPYGYTFVRSARTWLRLLLLHSACS